MKSCAERPTGKVGVAAMGAREMPIIGRPPPVVGDTHLLQRADAAKDHLDEEIRSLWTALATSRMSDEVGSVEDVLRQGRPGHRAPRTKKVDPPDAG